MRTERKYEQQLTGDHLFFATVILDLEDDDNVSHLPVSSAIHDDNDEAIDIVDNPHVELLRWHYRLNHLNFLVLQIFGRMGMLPIEFPCSICIFGAMQKQPRHPHAKMWNIRHIASITNPG